MSSPPTRLLHPLSLTDATCCSSIHTYYTTQDESLTLLNCCWISPFRTSCNDYYSFLKNSFYSSILYDVVGRGAFGKVKKCCDVNGRPFACKIMKKTLLQRKRVGRFRNMLDHVWKEIAIWKKLKHPNIVNLFEVITEVDCDKIYMISEFVQGGEILPTLSGKNVKTQPLSNERARKYFRDICKGIRYLHNNRVAHRDIKPGNILLDRTTDEVKITDFGVSDIFEERIASGEVGNSIHLKAKMVESPQNIMPELHAVDGRSENARDDENKVSTGGFGGGGGGGGRSDLTRQSAGTTCFLSPEETTGKEFHAFPCDIWALGVTLYYMLLGTVPFLGDTVLQVYDRIQHDPVVIPVTMKEELDPLAVDLIYALLNKVRQHCISCTIVLGREVYRLFCVPLLKLLSLFSLSLSPSFSLSLSLLLFLSVCLSLSLSLSLFWRIFFLVSHPLHFHRCRLLRRIMKPALPLIKCVSIPG